jgi:hypothetical protein
MRQIPPHLLFLGHAGDARDLPRLMQGGIAVLIDLAVNEPPVNPPRELAYCRFPLIDGAGNSRGMIRAAIDCAASLIRSRTPTLIICGAGMSRTPAIAAASLATVLGRSAQEVLTELCSSGPADVSAALWAEVTAALPRP